MDANSAIHCKNCHTLIQIPMPDPIVKKLPCACGVTETTRIVRYWATVAGVALMMIGSTIMTTCSTSSNAGVNATRAQAELTNAETAKTKVINDIDLRNMHQAHEQYGKERAGLLKELEAAKAEAARLSKELEEEKKKSSPLKQYLDKKEAEQATKAPETKKEEPNDDP